MSLSYLFLCAVNIAAVGFPRRLTRRAAYIFENPNELAVSLTKLCARTKSILAGVPSCSIIVGGV